VAISSDGSRVYFVAQGVLTDDPNPAGATATAGQPNLYLYEAASGETSFIGALAASDANRVWGAASFMGEASAVPMLGPEGGDGHILVFASRAPLTADDADGGAADVFRYDSAGESLLRVSKAAPGGGELPASGVEVNANEENPPSSNFATFARWASEDGNTIAFAGAEPLAPGDEDGENNPYLWKGGELLRLPGEVPPGISRYRPTVSPDGAQAGFSTELPLLAADGDTASDVYVARVDGGFPNPTPAISCDPLSEGSCQGSPSAPAATPGIATAAFVGPGNPKARPGCARQARRVRGLSRRAKALRRKATRATRRGNPRAARRMRRSAKASAKRANRLARQVRRCRRDSQSDR
jgi:hypothetical protein